MVREYCTFPSVWEPEQTPKAFSWFGGNGLVPPEPLFAMDDFLSDRTFHHSEFADLERLVRLKKMAGQRVAVCIPTLNEEETIGEIVSTLRDALVDHHPLIDRLVVIDSGSEDRTQAAATGAGAQFFPAAEIFPEAGPARGKGENLWKALASVDADLFCYIDGDIRNIHPRFVYGLLGPLLERPDIGYVKAFYDRPHPRGTEGRPLGGGRVTEILIRPLFSMFFPELCAVIQPLSGEYAARREILEAIPFPTGYGVEAAHLIEIASRFGMACLAQVDIDERIHRHQETSELGKMAFAILETVRMRLPNGTLPERRDAFLRVIQEEGTFRLAEWKFTDFERPPMAEYRSGFRADGG